MLGKKIAECSNDYVRRMKQTKLDCKRNTNLWWNCTPAMHQEEACLSSTPSEYKVVGSLTEIFVSSHFPSRRSFILTAVVQSHPGVHTTGLPTALPGLNFSDSPKMPTFFFTHPEIFQLVVCGNGAGKFTIDCVYFVVKILYFFRDTKVILPLIRDGMVSVRMIPVDRCTEKLSELFVAMNISSNLAILPGDWHWT